MNSAAPDRERQPQAVGGGNVDRPAAKARLRAACRGGLRLALGSALLLGLCPGLVAAEGLSLSNDHAGGNLLKADQAFRLVAAERQGQSLRISWDIAPGYYLYRKRISVQVLAPAGARLGAPELPKGEVVHDEYQGSAEIYHGSLQAALRWPADSAPPRRLRVGYQGCAEAGVCYPPQSRQIDVIDLPQ